MVNIDHKIIYGFCLKIGKLQFCLPIKAILHGDKTPLVIKPGIQ